MNYRHVVISLFFHPSQRFTRKFLTKKSKQENSKIILTTHDSTCSPATIPTNIFSYQKRKSHCKIFPFMIAQRFSNRSFFYSPFQNTHVKRVENLCRSEKSMFGKQNKTSKRKRKIPKQPEMKKSRKM